MTIRELFFIMLRAALWQEKPRWPRMPEPEEWRAVYSLAKTHAVSGLLFDVVSGLPGNSGIPRQLAAEWLVMAEGIAREYDRHVAVIEEMRTFWTDNGVEAVLFKGTRMADMYPVPNHRILGDIDWWMPGTDNMKRALDVVQCHGYDAVKDSDGDYRFVYGGIVVELHKSGMSMDGAVGELLMLNGHILHHTMVTGIGMRHLCDMAVAYHHFYGKYDADAYLIELKKSNMLKWTALLDAVIMEHLGTSKDIIPDYENAVNVPKRDVERFMELIMSDGNFGFGKQRRYANFGARSRIFLKYAPGLYLKRWHGLFMGRIVR